MFCCDGKMFVCRFHGIHMPFTRKISGFTCLNPSRYFEQFRFEQVNALARLGRQINLGYAKHVID